MRDVMHAECDDTIVRCAGVWCGAVCVVAEVMMMRVSKLRNPLPPPTRTTPHCNRDVSASGKMETLSRLLRRLKAKGHRVVLFSQFTRFMDIVDDFLSMAGYSFVRLDGSTNRVQRTVVSGFTPLHALA